MRKIIINALTVISVIIIAWGAFSFIDIVSDNNSQEPQHANINLFSLIGERS